MNTISRICFFFCFIGSVVLIGGAVILSFWPYKSYQTTENAISDAGLAMTISGSIVVIITLTFFCNKWSNRSQQANNTLGVQNQTLEGIELNNLEELQTQLNQDREISRLEKQKRIAKLKREVRDLERDLEANEVVIASTSDAIPNAA